MQEDIFGQASPTLRAQEWFQELFDEGGVYQNPNNFLSTRGDFVFIADPSANTVTVLDINEGRAGELSLQTDDDDNLWLDDVNVDERFHRQGIGTELVRLAVLHLENFFIPGVQQSNAYVFSLSDGGAHLINKCLREGFLDENNIRFDVPCEDDAEDPGYVIVFGRIGEIYAERSAQEEDSNSPSLSRSQSPN